MPTCMQIVAHADELLESPRFDDYGPNGLQVAGREQVRSLGAGVSSSLELFERAAEAGVDMLLVHHGLFWKSTPQAIDARARRRLQTLFDAGINLVAYHLPLDAHEPLGNNAIIASRLGMTNVEPALEARGTSAPIGRVGSLTDPCDTAAFGTRLRELFGQDPVHLGASPERIARVAVCSGGADSMFEAALGLGIDAYITGEPAEPTQALAREAGAAYFAVGHYASETFGIRALGEELAREFSLPFEFFDVPNPI